MPGTSIEERRRAAVLYSDHPFVCYVDADQRLPKTTDWSNLLSLFSDNDKLAGVQFKLEALAVNDSYWTRGFAFRHNLITGNPGPRKVIGTPCLVRRDIYSKYAYSSNISAPCDDIMIVYQLRSNGYSLWPHPISRINSLDRH